MLGRGAGNTGRTLLVWTRLLPNDLNSALAALYQRVPASQEDGKKRERWNLSGKLEKRSSEQRNLTSRGKEVEAHLLLAAF